MVPLIYIELVQISKKKKKKKSKENGLKKREICSL